LLGGSESCFEQVTIQQRGTTILNARHFHAIVPRANFTCNGRITGITASMLSTPYNGSDPFVEVWHPNNPGSDLFDKVGGVRILESEVVEVNNNNNTYWLFNITLNDDDRIEFEAGDVIGYYHPNDTRYIVGSVETEGYTVYYINESYNPSNATELAGIALQKRQPLFQFTIGMTIEYVTKCVNVYCIDIQCDILSKPSNGEISCSSGREAVGYEGDTCSFTCNTGYELTGSDNRTCQSGGSWSGSNTTCKKGNLLIHFT